MSERQNLFDDWAANYDKSLEDASRFPFEGYAAVLAGIANKIAAGAETVLDVGTGTGALAARFIELGCRVLGVDSSAKILVQAKVNVPAAEFRSLDLLSNWEVLQDRRFDAVVSAYVLHEFELNTKLTILERLSKLLKPTGRLVVGDISFETAATRDDAKRRWLEVWDDEHYWVAADLLPLLRKDFFAEYRQLSFCAGVYALTPLANSRRRGQEKQKQE